VDRAIIRKVVWKGLASVLRYARPSSEVSLHVLQQQMPYVRHSFYLRPPITSFRAGLAAIRQLDTEAMRRWAAGASLTGGHAVAEAMRITTRVRTRSRVASCRA